jgi:mRNA-degrading endonuclease toxin of MazEF toxin-antitoxin module
MDLPPQKGFVYDITFEFTNGTGSKPRPIVIIQNARRGDKDISFVQCTRTNVDRPLPCDVVVPAGPVFDEDTRIRCDHVFTKTIESIQKGRYRGILGPEITDKIDDALMIGLDLIKP